MHWKAVAQLDLLRRVLAADLVKSWGSTVDGGACKGEWSRVMAERFATVHAFEPDGKNFRQLIERVTDKPNIVLYRAALMDQPGRVEVFGGKPQSKQVRPLPGGETPALTVDCLELRDCGLLKLDLEGCEYLALMGAARTIARCRPVVIVELKDLGARFGHSTEDVEALLERMGYYKAIASRPDGVFVPL